MVLNSLNILILIFLSHHYVDKIANAQEFEEAFGFGAEDNEDNVWQVFPQVSSPVPEENFKATRQDQEDVEVNLSHNPMIAPDIILRGFVDSKVSLSNMDDVFTTKPQVKQPDRNEPMGNAIMDNNLDKEQLSSDSIHSSEYSFNISLREDDEKDIKPACLMNYDGEYGSFFLNFERDCVIQIINPSEESRLIFTCSPLPLGNCSTNKDALSINVMGDLKFKQNSFLYCGQDANIRAISFRNKLAIKIKKTEEIPGSTFCTYHSRMYKEYYPKELSVPCGRLGRIGKIVGGRRVPPGLFPWAVQLDITRVDGTQTGCTGTIVSPQYILTAAHCMKRAESVSAFMGGTDRLDIIGTEVLIQAEKYIIHKKWSSRTLVADIALVKLTQPIEYSDDLSPICLPTGRLLQEDLSGKRGVAIGWGRTDSRRKAPRKLYRVKLPLLSDYNCRNIYRKFYIPKVMMCTDSKKDAAICYGMSRNLLWNLINF